MTVSICKLTLISAPAGFGKTTLVSEWLDHTERPSAWLSLDEVDSEPTRFLTYFISALQVIETDIGAGLLTVLQSPQLPPIESFLTTLINEVAMMPDEFILVLDDYHLIDNKQVDDSLVFLLEHLPPQMHLVITTREDPPFPLARLRVRGQLTELRSSDLRFSHEEVAGFLNQIMGLELSDQDVNALENRTEGWIAGLQLAVISMQGHSDITEFIESFTGSHYFVMDYLVEEVLNQQPEHVHTFLLYTSIFDRLCGSLCDAVLNDSSFSGQAILETIERANLFLIPLDNERRWYRYHHLFADLLRQRLEQMMATPTSDSQPTMVELHIRASQWYESNSLEIEAFEHATLANDIERAERLLEGNEIPLLFRGVVMPVLNWLNALPKAILDEKPSLWVWSAFASSYVGLATDIENKLQAAERAIQGEISDSRNRDLLGRIASLRAMIAVPYDDLESIFHQGQRALEYLHPDNIPVRISAIWALGYAHQVQGDRQSATRAFDEVVSISDGTGNIINRIMAKTNLGQIQESDNQLHLASRTFQEVIDLVDNIPRAYACEAYLGLARIFYQWNDLDASEAYVQESIQLANYFQNIVTPASGKLLLAYLKLIQGHVVEANRELNEVEEFLRQNNFEQMIPQLVATQIQFMLHQENFTTAYELAQDYDIPLSQARVFIAQGEPEQAFSILESYRQHVEEKGWADEQLKSMILQALAFHTQGNIDEAIQLLKDALLLAEPNGFIRIFVDEGSQMEQLLSEASDRGNKLDYIRKLLEAFHETVQKRHVKFTSSQQPLIEPLSERELEILQLVADGLSNREISERLFLALSTVKGHNRNIFGKLQVQRRTEAVARARELGLL